MTPLVGLQCVVSGEQFATDVAGKVPLTLVDCVNVALKRGIGHVLLSTSVAGVPLLLVGLGVYSHVVLELLHCGVPSATFIACQTIFVEIIPFTIILSFHLTTS